VVVVRTVVRLGAILFALYCLAVVVAILIDVRQRTRHGRR
jgi:hypothetical protein